MKSLLCKIQVLVIPWPPMLCTEPERLKWTGPGHSSEAGWHVAPYLPFSVLVTKVQLPVVLTTAYGQA